MNIDVFMVLKDGKIVFEKYFGMFIDNLLYVWNLVGKILIVFVVGIVQLEGYLDILDIIFNIFGYGWISFILVQEEKIIVCY